MTTRITQKDLEAVVARINRATGNALTPYRRELDAPLSGPALDKGETRPYSHKANIGNYHLSGAYGGVALHQMISDGGDVRSVFGCGHVSKRELYSQMQAFLSGIDAATD